MLQRVRRPACHAPDSERRREQVVIQANAVQHQRRIKFDVGLEFAPRLLFFQQAQRHLFDMPRQVIQR